MKLGGRLVSLFAALAILSPALCVHAAEGGDEQPFLRIPGLPPIAMPPGTHVYGPGSAEPSPPNTRAPQAATPDADIYHEYGTVTPGGGRRDGAGRSNGGLGGRTGADMYGGTVIGPGGVLPAAPDARKRAAAPKKPPPTQEEKQAEIRKALTPKPSMAVARQRTLSDLYAKLAEAKDADESKGLASLIAAIWMRSSSDTASLLMARAEKAIGDKKYPLAVTVLDRVVELQPGWAEAWNKRASARYLVGDLNGAMSDVEQVLKLDPNHFGALNGMAMILQRTGFDKRALQVYRRELAVYPHQPELEKMVEKLTLEVEGQGI